MRKDDVWQMFKLTGKVDYYIKYKKMSKEGK